MEFNPDSPGRVINSPLRWRMELAAAAGTSADRVAVQCVHQHDAPLVDSTADALMRNSGMGQTTYL